MIELRRCKSDDPEFRSLVAELDAVLRILDGDDHEFFNAQNHPATITHAIVASFDGRPAGCGGFRPMDEHAVEIKRMYVEPEVRGKGVGRAVLAGLEAWAAECDYSCSRLETSKRLEPAVRLYHASGYSVIPNFGPYVDVQESVCLEKRLARVAGATQMAPAFREMT